MIKIHMPHCCNAKTLGGRIDSATGAAPSSNRWIEFDEITPGVFKIVSDNITDKGGDPIVDATSLAFADWDRNTVEDLDKERSGVSVQEKMSLHLRHGNVELDLFRKKFLAPSITDLKSALTHVAICAYCPGDILA